MFFRIRLTTAFVLLSSLGVGLASNESTTQPDGVKALDGEWVYVEERTEGKALEKQGPNTGPRLKMRVEKDAVVLVRSDGEIRMPLDGKPVDVTRSFGTARYRGE